MNPEELLNWLKKRGYVAFEDKIYLHPDELPKEHPEHSFAKRVIRIDMPVIVEVSTISPDIETLFYNAFFYHLREFVTESKQTFWAYVRVIGD
jgi:hypothetical protein